MCYGFSLAHALTIVSGQYVNPLDLSYRVKRVTSSHLTANEMMLGSEPEFFTSSFIQGALVGGICTRPPSDYLLKTLGARRTPQNPGLKQDPSKKRLPAQSSTKAQGAAGESTMEKARQTIEVYSKLMEGVAQECEGRRQSIHLPKFVEMGFGLRSGAQFTADQALGGLDKVLCAGGVAVLTTSTRIFRSSSMGNHAVAVVGRRMGKYGEYEYLLLDSRTKENCETWVKDVVAKNCEAGEIWVSRDAIKKHGSSIIGLIGR
jgi:hypothetical protein